MEKEEIEKFGLSRRCIFVGDIYGKEADSIRANLLKLSLLDAKAPINLFTDSPGGNTDKAHEIYDFIKGIPNDVYNYVIGRCESSANVILLACKPEHRFATQSSRFLIHAGSLHCKIDLSENIEKQLAQIKLDGARGIKRWTQLFKTETKLNEKQIKRFLFDSDRYRLSFYVKDALQYGLISRVLEPGEMLPCFKTE